MHRNRFVFDKLMLHGCYKLVLKREEKIKIEHVFLKEATFMHCHFSLCLSDFIRFNDEEPECIEEQIRV